MACQNTFPWVCQNITMYITILFQHSPSLINVQANLFPHLDKYMKCDNLCHDISKLFLCGNMYYIDYLFFHFFSDKMISNINVLGPVFLLLIFSKKYCTFVVSTMIDLSFFIKKYMPESDLQHLNPEDYRLALACLFHASDTCFNP